MRLGIRRVTIVFDPALAKRVVQAEGGKTTVLPLGKGARQVALSESLTGKILTYVDRDGEKHLVPIDQIGRVSTR